MTNVPRTKQGVLDLNKFGKQWTSADVPPREKTPEDCTSPPPPEAPWRFIPDTADLLYDPSPLFAVKASFPRALIERDYDGIHDERLSIYIPGTPQEEWYRWLLRHRSEKWAGISLRFQLDLRMHTEFIRQLMLEEGYDVARSP